MAAIATQLTKIDGRSHGGRRLKRDAARRQELAAGLLADLGRPTNTTDEIWADNMAAMVWRAEYLEAAGIDSTELRQRINQGMRTAGRKLAPAAPQRPDDKVARIKARYEQTSEPAS